LLQVLDVIAFCCTTDPGDKTLQDFNQDSKRPNMFVHLFLSIVPGKLCSVMHELQEDVAKRHDA
jgi:hypothetical protein